jgi:hypothetical protein
VDFGALLEPNFEPFFGPFRVPNFPVLLGFLRSEGRFWAVFRRVLDRTFWYTFTLCAKAA